MAAIFDVLLPLTRYTIRFSLIELPVPENMPVSRWNSLAIVYTSRFYRYFITLPVTGYRLESLLTLSSDGVRSSTVVLPSPANMGFSSWNVVDVMYGYHKRIATCAAAAIDCSRSTSCNTWTRFVVCPYGLWWPSLICFLPRHQTVFRFVQPCCVSLRHG